MLIQTSARKQMLSALLFFLIIQILGLLLRFQFVQALPGFHYPFVLHAHSHVALLGWAHAMLLIFLPRLFVAAEPPQRYSHIFWLSQLTVLGMLLSFPLQGYAAVSITFSTLSLFCNYAFVFVLLRDTRQDTRLSCRLLRASLGFLVLSSLGPWALGPIIALKLKHTPVYYLAIYFYLHFQYNAWFVLGGLAWGLRLLEKQKLTFTLHLERAVNLLIWSVLPGFALSALWLKPPLWVWLLAGLGAGLQFFSLIEALRFVKASGFFHLKGLKRLPWRWNWAFFALSALCFILKILLQSMTAFPYFAQLAADQRTLVIFYLHLVLLGVVSSFFLAAAWLPSQSHVLLNFGLGLFLLGFVSSELILLYQGLAMAWQWPGIPQFYLSLFAVSLCMPLGLFGLFIYHVKKPSE